MLDRNGIPLAIGDQVEWERRDGTTRVGWVRRLKLCPIRKIPVVVVDDGAQDNPDLATNGFHEAKVIDAPERVRRVDGAEARPCEPNGFGSSGPDLLPPGVVPLPQSKILE